MPRAKRLLSCMPAFVLVAAPTFAAKAQNPEEPAASPSSAEASAADARQDERQIYAPAEFARFSPRTALDMLRQVPGFLIRQQGQERGLGQASGNVLINGERISGKSNDAITVLGRIPAANVERIEVADAASFNISGISGQVANIIAQAAGVSGQFEWQGEARPRNTQPLFTNFSGSVSGSTGPLDYTVGLRNDSFRRGNAGPSLVLRPDGTLIDTRQEQSLFTGERPRLSAGLRYSLPNGHTANVNLSYERFWFDQSETSDRRGAGLPDRLRILSSEQDRYSYEIGGDYSASFSHGELKLIGLRTFRHNPSDTLLVTDFSDETPSIGSRFLRIGDEAETIGRAEYRWQTAGNAWEISAEAAFNSLDNVSELFTLVSEGDFARVPLPGGTAEVAEGRYQGAIAWGKSLTPKLALQASAGAEYSQLQTSGPLGQTRSFIRPKGFVAAAWKADFWLDVNAKLERRVGQLNFSDFLASANLGRDTEDAANPDLVPPQSWEAELEAVSDFGAWGTATARIYTRLISDIIDQIPVGSANEAAGNIDRARVYGMALNSTVQLSRVGWAGARLDAELRLQTSRVDDPLTGNSRLISNDLVRRIEVELRHDLPATDWAWGGEISQTRRAPVVRLGEVFESYEMSPFDSEVFLEHKDVFGLTIQAAVRNLFGADDLVTRSVFAGRRTDPLEFVELRNRSVGPTLSLGVSGTF